MGEITKQHISLEKEQKLQKRCGDMVLVKKSGNHPAADMHLSTQSIANCILKANMGNEVWAHWRVMAEEN
jgi:hypothetical protein